MHRSTFLPLQHTATLIFSVDWGLDWGMNTTELAQSLPAVLASVPDPRGLRGRRHPLPAILTLAVCAMLSGARSLYAIHQWGRQQDAATVQAMGFTRPRTPAVGSLHTVFRRLDAAAFETALAGWSRAGLPEGSAIAVDGKALRGIHGQELPGVRLVAGYAHESSLVVGQKGGGAGTGGTDNGPATDRGTAAGGG